VTVTTSALSRADYLLNLLGLQLLSEINAQALMSFNKRLGFTR
jgi:hypothetical protein